MKEGPVLVLCQTAIIPNGLLPQYENNQQNYQQGGDETIRLLGKEKRLTQSYWDGLVLSKS